MYKYLHKRFKSMSIINCPKCNTEFDNKGKWGLRKFCSQSCANSKVQTQEMRAKKAAKLEKSGVCKYCSDRFGNAGSLRLHERSCEFNPKKLPGSFFAMKHSLETKAKMGLHNIAGTKVPKSILDMSKRTASKVLKRLEVGCSCCGWDKGSCDIHHIIPKSKGGPDINDNLTVICPNCHRLAHEGKITEFISITTQIGDEWRKYYFAHA